MNADAVVEIEIKPRVSFTTATLRVVPSDFIRLTNPFAADDDGAEKRFSEWSVSTPNG